MANFQALQPALLEAQRDDPRIVEDVVGGEGELAGVTNALANIALFFGGGNRDSSPLVTCC